MSVCRNRLWTVGSGKGGAGKGFLVVAMGAELARSGHSVILVDAHLASPSLHSYLGIKTAGHTLLDVLERKLPISDALMPTPETEMRFVSCVGEELGMADLAPGQLQQMAELISHMEADFVLLKTGYGSSFAALDLFNLAKEPFVVATPDAASMHSAFGFLKNAVYRRIQKTSGNSPVVGAALKKMREDAGSAKSRTMNDFLDLLRPVSAQLMKDVADIVDSFRPRMLINMASSEHDQRMADILLTAAWKFLNVEIRFCGMIPFDSSIRAATQRTNLLEKGRSDASWSHPIRRIALELAGEDPAAESGGYAPEDPTGLYTPAMGLNDNLAFLGRDLHIQTEDRVEAGRCIATQVFCDGHVILSTKSEYPSRLRNPQHMNELVEMMRHQHYGVIREIESRNTKVFFDSAPKA